VAILGVRKHEMSSEEVTAKEKVERFRTGGGSCVTDVDDKLLKILGNRAVPLINTYDSDADYHKASGITH